MMATGTGAFSSEISLAVPEDRAGLRSPITSILDVSVLFLIIQIGAVALYAIVGVR
jgi:hypothetical protein